MSTVQELITQANYYLNKQNTGNLEQDNATDTKGKAMLQEAVTRLEKNDYHILKVMTDDDLSVESSKEIKWENL
ncbi:hypothetical protein [Staphylococcus sp. GDY8P120P]|uniref:hypothetical protein n=1 Tax=Staphylococcus sp. GDY8P120P TaxID=2804156 RepID=UPI001AEBB440|nr:hypothetical protein [Staphylococcus sp. GDY8P120P]